MKDSEFIELLNLYLDSEISPTDASRLEAEVQRDPQRYQVYLQYCRMQKACTLLAADFTTDAPSVVALKSAPRRSAAVNLFAVAGVMAAAACVAFVFVTRNSPSTPAPDSASAVATTSAPVPTEKPNMVAERTIPQTVTVPEHRPEFKPVLKNASLLAGNTSEVMQDARFDWIDFQISPMSQGPAQTLRFDPNSPSRPTQRFIPGSLHPVEESVSIEFRR